MDLMTVIRLKAAIYEEQPEAESEEEEQTDG